MNIVFLTDKSKNKEYHRKYHSLFLIILHAFPRHRLILFESFFNALPPHTGMQKFKILKTHDS